jgi:hypothetical protein
VRKSNFYLMTNHFNQFFSFRTAILSSGFCQSNGIDISQNTMNITATAKNTNISNSQYVGHQLVKFYTTLYGTSRILALCNVIAIDQVSGSNFTLMFVAFWTQLLTLFALLTAGAWEIGVAIG